MRPSRVVQWADGTNYIAGAYPWSGTALKNQPGANYFTPQIPVAAQQMNWQLFQFGDAMSTMLREWGQLPALNWRVGISAPLAAANFQSVAYDAVNARWIACLFTGGGARSLTIGASYNAGETWTQMGSGLPGVYDEACAIIAHPTNPNVTNVLAFNTTNNVATILKLNTGVSNNWAVAQGTIGNAGSMFGEFAVFNSLILAFVSGSGGNATAWSSADGLTWTSNAVPAALNSATSWSVAASPTSVMAVDRTAAQSFVMRSTNGTAWSTIALPSIAGSDVPTGIAYGTYDNGQPGGGGCYVVSVRTTSGTKIYRSTDDGLTFTVIATPTFFFSTDVKGFGSLFVLAVENPDRSSIQYYSIDAGISWRPISAGLSDNIAVGSAVYVRPRYAVSANGFVYFNAKIARFSYEQGLTPPVSNY